MSNIKTDTTFLCQKARELGAVEAKAIPASEVIIDKRAFLKCLVPLCSHYGVDLLCPPNLPSPDQFAKMLGKYRAGILIKLDIPREAVIERKQSPGDDYIDTGTDSRIKLNEIINKLEALCIEKGYFFAAGLSGGSCPLCLECVGVKSGQPCRHPFKARPAMEAMGIDVMSTINKAGFALDFGPGEKRSWIGLLLVD